VRPEGLGITKKSVHFIGFRTRDLQACNRNVRLVELLQDRSLRRDLYVTVMNLQVDKLISTDCSVTF
jgi:hypothetical protein